MASATWCVFPYIDSETTTARMAIAPSLTADIFIVVHWAAASAGPNVTTSADVAHEGQAEQRPAERRPWWGRIRAEGPMEGGGEPWG